MEQESAPNISRYRNKELSWLSFNARVLQEAENNNIPLLERLKFLGIYSNNLDEFFKVRVATLRRLAQLGKKSRKVLFHDPRIILEEIGEIVRKQQIQFLEAYNSIKKELEADGIFILNESQLNEGQRDFVLKYFIEEIQPKLFPVFLSDNTDLSSVKDDEIFLAMILKSAKEKIHYAMINIPTNEIGRFIILPKKGDEKYIILQDDVIRVGLPLIFDILEYKVLGAYTFKVTRDAELDLNDDLADSYIRKIAKGLEKRKEGNAVRIVYDENMPEDLINYFIDRLSLKELGSMVPGGRYHNFKDFIEFPDLGHKYLKNKRLPPIQHPAIAPNTSILKIIKEKDVLLHIPYQPFIYIIDLLREAAIDPRVRVVKMTLYRVAKNSSVIKALINAAKNGKQVTAVLELQARFDEESNMYWSRKLAEAGVRVIFGVPGLKVHSKLVLIQRKEDKHLINYVGIGTGNFNESSAQVFSDSFLLTSHNEIAKDVANVFEFFYQNYKVHQFKQLLVAPFYMRDKLIKLIKEETKNALNNERAEIYFKLNNFSDHEIIELIYEAYKAGVDIKINVRGMFTLIPRLDGEDINIECIAIIDRFLEHSRILYFYAAGEEKLYLSSADLMARNLDRRTEIMCPILDTEIKEELKKMIELQWQDNTSTRVLDNDLTNTYRKTDSSTPIRSQIEFYNYLKGKMES